MQDHSKYLARQLEGVLEGAVNLEAVLEEASSYGEPMRHCFHGLQHFLADSDIRRKDTSYKEMQEAEMRKLIRVLRSDGDADSLRSISFLGSSP